MNKPNKRPMPLHPTLDGFGIEVGKPTAPGIPWVMFDAEAFIIYTDCHCLNNEAVGLLMRKVMRAVVVNDEKELAKYDFVLKRLPGFSDTQRPHIPRDVRRRVLAAGGCAYCGSADRLEVDHILAWSKGGTHDETNLQCLCKSCNSSKQAKDEASYLKINRA